MVKIFTQKIIKEVGFTQSRIDPCIFCQDSTIDIVYTNDSILSGPDRNKNDTAVADIKAAALDITDEGNIGNFLVNIKRTKEGSIYIFQPHLIMQSGRPPAQQTQSRQEGHVIHDK